MASFFYLIRCKYHWITSFVVCTALSLTGMAQPSLPPAYKMASDTAAYLILPPGDWQMMTDSSGKLSLQQVQSSNRFQDTNRKVNYRFQVYWLQDKTIKITTK